MAIRSAELGLSAAIGVGEKIYERLTSATLLEIDPLNKKIEVMG